MVSAKVRETPCRISVWQARSSLAGSRDSEIIAGAFRHVPTETHRTTRRHPRFGLPWRHPGRHGTRMVEPVVCRDSSARCAFAASARGNVWFTVMRTAPPATMSNSALRRSLQVRPVRGIRHQRRPGDVERPLRAQNPDVERIDLSRRLTEAHEHPPGTKAVEAARERVAPNRIVDDRNPGAVRQLPDPIGEILPRIDDRVIAAVRPSELRLLVAAHGADDRRSEMPGPLACDQAHAARGGMEQDGLAGSHRVRPAQQVLDGHALQHHRRGLPWLDAGRNLHHLVGRHQAFLRIRRDRWRRVRDPIPHR